MDAKDVESLIVRYYYVPTSEFDEIYMNRDVYKALRQAIASSVYLDLHDDEKAICTIKEWRNTVKPLYFKDHMTLMM